MTDPIIGRFGFWSVLTTDPLGKRAMVECVCGARRTMSLPVLQSGASSSCGCRQPSPAQIAAKRHEVEQQRQRRERRNWRPQS